MKNAVNPRKKVSFFQNIQAIDPRDEKLLRDYSLTTFEKIILIMTKIKKILINFKVPNEIIAELNWVVENLSNKSLFDVDIVKNEKDFEELSAKYADIDIKSYVNIISNYSAASFGKTFRKVRSNSGNKRQVEDARLKEDLNVRVKSYVPSMKVSNNQKSIMSLLKEEFNEIKEEEYANDTLKCKSSLFNPKLKGKRNDSFEKQQEINHSELNNIRQIKSSLDVSLSTETKMNKEYGERSISDQQERLVVKSNSSKGEIAFNTDLMSIPEKNENKVDNDIFKDSDYESSDESGKEEKKMTIIRRNMASPSILNTNISHNFNLESLDFNIFDFEMEVKRENTLSFLYNQIISKLKDEEKVLDIDEEKLNHFSLCLSKGYYNNPFHNSTHAADVCQTLYSWLRTAEISKSFYFSPQDQFSIYTAAIAHDYKHPGFNNNYLVITRDLLAITYNDKSVLESYHVAEAFKLLLENDIFENFSETEFRLVRKRIVEAILSTDMSMHFKSVSVMKGKIEYLEIEGGKNIDKLVKETGTTLFEEQQEMINFLTHCADISHNTKSWDISKVWSKAIYDEFFNQGDEEKKKGFSVSMFCDRETTSIPKAQIGFINGIIIPTFDILVRLFPALRSTMENLENNAEKWEEMIE